MLIIPPLQFAHCTDNLTSTPPAATIGTQFGTDTLTANVDGVPRTVIGTALTHDVHYVVIGITGINASGFISNSLTDILYDPAGGTSWSVLIEDLVSGFTAGSTAGTVCFAQYYCFPLWVKAGATFGVTAKTSRGAPGYENGRIGLWLYGEPNRPEMWWCGQKVEGVGVDASTSSGTNITPGNTGAWSSWTNIGSTTNGRYGAIQFGWNGTDSSALGQGSYWQIGFDSVQLAGSPTMFISTSTAEVSARCPFGPIWTDIPAGKQLQVRATSSGAAEANNVALYGVY
jgi:hypothetical protein